MDRKTAAFTSSVSLRAGFNHVCLCHPFESLLVHA